MISVLPTGPKVHAFKRSQGDGFLRAIKIRNTPSFGGEVKPDAPCRKMLWHVRKSLASMNKNCSQGQIRHSFARSSYLLPDDSAGRIDRELWWTNQELPFVDIIPPWFSMLGRWTIGQLVSAVQRRSLNHHQNSKTLGASILCNFTC
jgi:hypothetical protein